MDANEIVQENAPFVPKLTTQHTHDENLRALASHFRWCREYAPIIHLFLAVVFVSLLLCLQILIYSLKLNAIY